MGYFSNLDIVRECYCVDRSYPTPAKQLLWRIEDLEERLTMANSGKIHSSFKILDEELPYVPVDCLCSISDIVKALKIAREKYTHLLLEEEIDESNNLYSEAELGAVRKICLDEIDVGVSS